MSDEGELLGKPTSNLQSPVTRSVSSGSRLSHVTARARALKSPRRKRVSFAELFQLVRCYRSMYGERECI